MMFNMILSYSEFISYEFVFPAAVALSILFLVYLNHGFKSRNLPPGPPGLPLVGIRPFLKPMALHFQLEEMQKKYGDPFCFNFTGYMHVSLGTFKTLREAYVSKADCFAEKVSDFNLPNHLFGNALFTNNGEEWKTHRKFFVQLFKQHGMSSGRDYMTDTIYNTMDSILRDLHARKGEPVNIFNLLVDKCSVVMRRIMFGEDGISKEELQEFSDSYAKMFASISGCNFFLVGGFSRYFIYPFLKERAILEECRDKMIAILLETINRHKSNFDPDHVRDLIDSYLKERHDRKKRGDSTAKYFTDHHLAWTLLQLVGDGIHTVAILIKSFLQGLTDYPKEQEKIFKELIDVIGTDRQPTLEDRSKLPYANAFLYEIMRVSDLMPLLPSLQCTNETTIGGYRIPKGTITVINIWNIHHDLEVYEDPYKFNPSRFIPSEGKKRPELPILFGLGKRACIGEAFTMMEAFLFMITIVKNFRITIPEGTAKKSTLFFQLGNTDICAHPRDNK